ncbi:hypothetical protein [Spiroplasma taiwanense]|uniref:Uncharacterized protein n=1 Tax=Spiroplasma taiwanense CT-1 TaxID=1276220 RepID=S5LU43_9MOLU|nr:hypothetical protein [Spiroplasma taiwanense]AGR41259.1 hypothetical protein STAIW_v1c06400 [Spiroplasma taiwanense CT-1]
MDLQQKWISEYKKTQNLKKQILELEKKHGLNLAYKNDLEKEVIAKQQEIKKETNRKFKEYQLHLEQQKGISIKYEDVQQSKLINSNLLEELDTLKNQLEETTHKANSSYDKWNYLKKAMDTPSMEEIYAKDSQEDRPSELPQV